MVLHCEFTQYFRKSYCLNNSTLKTALINDFVNPTFKIQLQVLGLLSKLLTGPWMTIFYNSKSELSHIDGFKLVKDVIKNIDCIIDSGIVDYSKDLFGNVVSFHEFPGLNKNVTNVVFQDLLILMFKQISIVLKRQYAVYLCHDDRTLQKLSDSTSSARLHNMDSEEVMGMFSAQKLRSPNATMILISSKIRAKKNYTIKYLDEKSEKAGIIKKARSYSRQLKKRNQCTVTELISALSKRIVQKMQKKEQLQQNRFEKNVK